MWSAAKQLVNLMGDAYPELRTEEQQIRDSDSGRRRTIRGNPGDGRAASCRCNPTHSAHREDSLSKTGIAEVLASYCLAKLPFDSTTLTAFRST